MGYKPIGKRHFQVRDCIFNRTVHVLLNYSDSDYERWRKRLGDTNFEAGLDKTNFAGFTAQMDWPNRPSEWLICIREFDWKIADQGTLVHEIVHVVIKIFDQNNISFNVDTQEFLAHAIGNLYEDIAAKIWNKQLRAKAKSKR